MVSDPDTVFVNLHIDADPSFGSSQSKTGALLSQGFFFDRKKKKKIILFSMCFFSS
jgi:hypothetical protein